MKYVIIRQRNDQGNLEDVAVIFEDKMKHSQFEYLDKAQAISAGFVELDWGGPDAYCYGESETLKLKSRPEDTLLVQKALGLL